MAFTMRPDKIKLTQTAKTVDDFLFFTPETRQVMRYLLSTPIVFKYFKQGEIGAGICPRQ